MRSDTKAKAGMDCGDYSYVETPHEAAARYLDHAIGEISMALALDCMKGEPQLRLKMFQIGQELCQYRIDIGGTPKPGAIAFGKLEAK